MKTSTIRITAAIILAMAASITLQAQILTQTIKGRIVDNESQSPLIGASIIVLGTNPLLGAISDNDGYYRIDQVPVGRYTIKVTCMGYDPAAIPEIQINSGKEVYLACGMKQSVTELKEVTVNAFPRKDMPLNSMASISARSFSVEETRRYAGGMDDPARMVSAFAGVSVGNIQNNAIVIRGNSPKGVAWHLEGVEIPNPNHFAGGNVAGGGFVTIFSSQMLANSDFFTGAFPAEYGNALAGVFDMKLRNGNNEKREHTFQAGMLGIDISSEGPFVKGKKASYLFNYRYSTFGLLTAMKILPDKQIPRYQDLSFKINLPTARAGTFSVWGIGGIDHLNQPFVSDSSKWESDWDRIQMKWSLYTGAAGVSHKVSAGKNAYVNTTLAVTGVFNQLDQKQLGMDLVSHPYALLTDQSKKIQFSTFLKNKLSAKHTIKTGINFNELFFNYDLNGILPGSNGLYGNYAYQKGKSFYTEIYFQSKYDITRNLVLNSGINCNYFELNKGLSLDPRAAIRWNFMPDHTISFGYGKHSQLEELRMYFIRQEINGTVSYPNKKMGVSRAHHFVLGYDWNITDKIRFKAEPYFQYLYNVPGIKDSSWSMINFEQDWSFGSALENNSRGKNIGIDLTLERFLSNNYYYLITASLFNSTYRGGDDIWRSTRFNKGYVINLLAGKEFYLRNNRVIGINGRINVMGGQRFSPVLTELSLQQRNVVYDHTKAFTRKGEPMYYLDVTLTYRKNKKKYSSVWALQVKNILGTPLYEGEYYNYRTNTIESAETVIIVPVISYKVEF